MWLLGRREVGRGREPRAGFCRGDGQEGNGRGGGAAEDPSVAAGWSAWEQGAPGESPGVSETPRAWHASVGHVVAMRVHAVLFFLCV